MIADLIRAFLEAALRSRCAVRGGRCRCSYESCALRGSGIDQGHK